MPAKILRFDKLRPRRRQRPAYTPSPANGQVYVSECVGVDYDDYGEEYVTCVYFEVVHVSGDGNQAAYLCCFDSMNEATQAGWRLARHMNAIFHFPENHGDHTETRAAESRT